MCENCGYGTRMRRISFSPENGCDKVAKHLAPAAIHSEASALILFTIEGTGDSRRSKTRLFCSFHTSHPMRSATEREPLRGTPGAVDTLTRHSMVDMLGLHLEGTRCGVPSHAATTVQTRRVYLQPAIRCSVVSGAFLQSGQTGQWSQFLRVSLSEVQTRSCKMSQAKNLHFGGAHVFHIMASAREAAKALNCAL
jgi:hypothetical protein